MTANPQRPHTRPTSTVPALRHALPLLLCALLTLAVARPSPAAAPEKALVSWDDAKRISIDELARLLKDPTAAKPEMFHVGFRVLFVQAHIPGSRFAGPGASPAGLETLRKAVAAVPKAKTVVLYCGCCPWEKCPNMEQPWRLLVAAGFTDVRVLYIPTNFGRDWVGRGHPSASGSGDRG
ncbi:MAG TPA: rhodanese-like domain-containing protein [Thermoanaerobaculia bacterium]|nr:rhodanese-like domain-containing protein [Thermoanaerobaculia bacterium]HQN07164.1 rhodanese-like domain-containing protein [Thermoanaerobaculia bacterium]HQP87864.1 rhodanese-like domain-containing protein [Thermoanaerobaculia bacterium]